MNVKLKNMHSGFTFLSFLASKIIALDIFLVLIIIILFFTLFISRNILFTVKNGLISYVTFQV